MARRSPSTSARRLALLLGGVVLALQTATSGDAAYSRADADALQRKIDEIVAASARGTRTAKLTPVSEREVNAYMRYHLRDQVPTGIDEPVITILGDGRVAGRATVDLDAVNRASRSNSWFDPMRLLTGRLPVTAQGILTTANGVGRFTFESATVSGVPVPKTLLQQVVSYYSRSEEQPQGINLDDPFALPADIQEIRVEPGRAVVVQ